MEKINKVASLYIATLKCMALIHSNSHWLAKGATFYGNHLLFERIYKSALEDLDQAAEKFVGLFGEEVLSYELQNELIYKILSKYKELEGFPIKMSLSIEKDFIKLSKSVYEAFEKSDKMTLGLDDLILSICNSREEAAYLLQQVLKGE